MPWPEPSSPGTYTSSGPEEHSGLPCTGASRHTLVGVAGVKSRCSGGSPNRRVRVGVSAAFSAASSCARAARCASGSPMSRAMYRLAASTSLAAAMVAAVPLLFTARLSAAAAACSASCAATCEYTMHHNQQSVLTIQ